MKVETDIAPDRFNPGTFEVAVSFVEMPDGERPYGVRINRVPPEAAAVLFRLPDTLDQHRAMLAALRLVADSPEADLPRHVRTAVEDAIVAAEEG